MTQKTVSLLFIILLLAGISGATISTDAGQADWSEKVDPQVLLNIESGETDFLVFLRDQADLSQAEKLLTKEEKGAFVYQTLSSFADSHQKSLRAALDVLGADYKSFWITNMVWVSGDTQTLEQIARRDDVAKIYDNPKVSISVPMIDPTQRSPQAVDGIEWNVMKINAPILWSMGYTGEGVVIGGQDTGYDWDHKALIEKYRGWDGVTADHNYNWHDTVTSGGGSCGTNTTEPCDDWGHGTHTMGTMVGDDHNGNQIGIAPDAKWIGCRNMNVGIGTPASYIECYQWFVAPTDINGNNPDTTKAPHVINNSWSCPESEGCTDPNVLLSAVQSVRAAGIVTVHSAGNEGPTCSTVANPATIYGESFSVGATYSDDSIVGFSSRGPVTTDGSNRMKPNVVAPGYGIRSSLPGDSYGSSNGTSMAAPHVAGLVALLLSANPHLIGQVEEVETIIQNTALPRISSQDCGGVPGSSIPNNTYGYGQIDAWRALINALNILIFPIMFK